MKTKPVVKVGDYCRINSKRLEGKVVSVEDKTITVKTIGFGEEFSLEASDIFPSLGKEAREAQAIKAMSGLIWNVGDKCRVVKENGLKAAKIFSIDKDGEGRQYAILGFDNLDEDSVS